MLRYIIQFLNFTDRILSNLAKPTIHIFKEYNVGKYKSVKHYELITVLNGVSKLSNEVNVSKNRNFAKSMPDYWIKLKEGNKWSKNNLTGLFKTSENLTYKGDSEKKKNLLIFKFSDLGSTLTVYYFDNYYTVDLTSVFEHINN